jgi:hypothetical protein
MLRKSGWSVALKILSRLQVPELNPLYGAQSMHYIPRGNIDE